MSETIEKKNVKEENLEVSTAAENEHDFVFSKPYSFEGKTYDKIDLSGLLDIKAGDMVAATKYMSRMGINIQDEEMALPYALFIASRATGEPIEFFDGLKPVDALRLKGKVIRFFYGLI